MKKVLLLAMVVFATWFGVTYGGGMSVSASPFKSPQPPPKQMTKFKIVGDNAYADFYSTGNCVSGSVTAWAGESVTKEGPGKPAATSSAAIEVFGYNACTGSFIYGYGSTNLSPNDFKVQGNLQSPTLNAVVPVCCDQNGASYPATVNLTWTGTGAIGKSKTSYTSKSPGCKNSYSSEGSGRNATMSGNITVQGTTFTPQPGSYAVINSSKEGAMTIGCN